MRPGDAPAAAASTVPLGASISRHVIEQCAAEASTDDAAHAVILRVKRGGWAADATRPYSAGASHSPPLERDAEWPLDEEVAQWRIRASAQRQGPRSTLNIVDDFLRGPLASELIPVELQDW